MLYASRHLRRERPTSKVMLERDEMLKEGFLVA